MIEQVAPSELALRVAMMQRVGLGQMAAGDYLALFDPCEKAIRDISVPLEELVSLAEARARAQAASEPF